MHQSRLCRFLDHSCPDTQQEGRLWNWDPLAVAARAHLLTCWLAEDAPAGATAPALYVSGSTARSDNDGLELNPATAYENGLFPHVDPASGAVREVLACYPISDFGLVDLIPYVLLRPWRERGLAPGSRVSLLLGELLERLTLSFADAVVVEAVDIADGRAVPGELHVIIRCGINMTRISVLPRAAVPVRRNGLSPDPACSFGGHGCPQGHLLDDAALERAHVALRAMSAGTVLTEYLPQNKTTHVTFTVKLASHDRMVVDDGTARRWLSESRWSRELPGEAEAIDTRMLLAELAGFRDEILEIYSENATAERAKWASDEDLDMARLGAELTRELFDVPVNHVAGGEASQNADALCVIGRPEPGACEIPSHTEWFVVVGPDEALRFEIDTRG